MEGFGSGVTGYYASGEDGMSILGKLRKSSATKELPIIMMTAKGDGIR
jgi:DNA-binding response OmpR family regulator